MKLHRPRLEEDFGPDRELFAITIDTLAQAEEESVKAQCKGALLERWDRWLVDFDGVMHSAEMRNNELRLIRAEKDALCRKFRVKVKTPRDSQRRKPKWWERILRINPNAPKIEEG